jgi:menaquinone-dependent protoporphyrinogen IX oxidase
MKSLLVYYSHYGNTAFVTHKAWIELGKKGETDLFEVEYLGGKKNIIERFFYRFFPFFVRIKPIPVDLSNYDLLFLGIPVLAAHPSSALLKYIKSLKNIDNKKIICCYVYGIELSAKHCATNISKILGIKGNPRIMNIFISWLNVHNESFLNKTLIEAINKLN